eukprot:CAMPEP_0202857054 /NCGR_PEP_ID=MMETSP1391-20130828/136_1 /ASSEMBLY_ACC=CAM_ASM_000867 /TAXON_ID=1034604 /ORGANISM="Chlamydomonas leiostraca, Strain SAG 11-49" /LENGTH=107 /DNA_ID=CAMNT_0049535809 /DNA_START=253 /DNA_END=578 /DNA_ORIENTATION=-
MTLPHGPVQRQPGDDRQHLASQLLSSLSSKLVHVMCQFSMVVQSSPGKVQITLDKLIQLSNAEMSGEAANRGDQCLLGSSAMSERAMPAGTGMLTEGYPAWSAGTRG